MISLDEAKQRIGDRVIYTPRGQPKLTEEGTISKVNDAGVIFVHYGDDRYSKATYPQDLEWAT